MDNASNNDTMMQHFEDRKYIISYYFIMILDNLGSGTMWYYHYAKHHRLRCIGHIIGPFCTVLPICRPS